ncbi:MAG: sulfate reduction electron transfer complex DsrMKJOP subunit DsrJ [Acidobacteriota bacterium]
MRDRPIIFGGLMVFLGLATFPIWYNVAAGKTSRGPDIKLPAQEKECVAATDYMRSSHMDLLVEWREQVVRQHVRRFTAFNGRNYNISLTGTCLKQCHTSKADFCDRCHDYAGAGTPYCWDCHNEPRPAATVAHRLPQ